VTEFLHFRDRFCPSVFKTFLVVVVGQVLNHLLILVIFKNLLSEIKIITSRQNLIKIAVWQLFAV
jgi:hypothetical protein